MLKTRLSKLLGIEFPIFSAPMGPDIAGPDLAAAVSGAGGLGLMQAQFSPPADFREQIQRVRRATDKPFGVNFILALRTRKIWRCAWTSTFRSFRSSGVMRRDMLNGYTPPFFWNSNTLMQYPQSYAVGVEISIIKCKIHKRPNEKVEVHYHNSIKYK
jgi:NAD(P)H-dependent flavin oxidoreductase YrpB (nitropropane dioxygenase family)